MGIAASAPAPAPAAARKSINFKKVILCGILTAVAWGVLSYVLLLIVGQGFFDGLRSAGSPVAPPFSTKYLAFVALTDLALGVYSMWLYAAIRPRFGAGPKTAVIAGFAVWLFGATVDGAWASFRLMPVQPLVVVVFCALPAVVLATVLGARFYSE